MNQVQTRTAVAAHWRRLRPLYLILIVCTVPVVASYLAYYVFPPSGRTNYGVLVEPQVPVPALTLTRLDGSAFDLRSLRGNWVMLAVDRADCAGACQQKLWNMRQVRTATGKERDRVDRVLLIVDDAPLSTLLLREYDGTHFVRASGPDVAAFLALPPDGSAKLEDCVWLIDPLSHQMLRWPKDADPSRMKKDLDRLLRASRVG
jgi:hypothetical protein